jgi:hypothetical protein
VAGGAELNAPKSANPLAAGALGGAEAGASEKAPKSAAKPPLARFGVTVGAPKAAKPAGAAAAEPAGAEAAANKSIKPAPAPAVLRAGCAGAGSAKRSGNAAAMVGAGLAGAGAGAAAPAWVDGAEPAASARYQRFSSYLARMKRSVSAVDEAAEGLAEGGMLYSKCAATQSLPRSRMRCIWSGSHLSMLMLRTWVTWTPMLR